MTVKTTTSHDKASATLAVRLEHDTRAGLEAIGGHVGELLAAVTKRPEEVGASGYLRLLAEWAVSEWQRPTGTLPPGFPPPKGK